MSEFLKAYLKHRKRSLKIQRKNAEKLQSGGYVKRGRSRATSRKYSRGRRYRLVGY